MEEVIKKAEILVESLPYIKKFLGKTFVIKFGGSILTDNKILNTLMEDILLLRYVGVNPVIVHGGGPDISKTLDLFEKESKFINGLRVTDKETMEIVEMILGGKVNKKIVSKINKLGEEAVGICGIDGGLIKAKKLVLENVKQDMGYVGEVEEIKPDIIEHLLTDGYIPVVAPIGVNKEGDSFNINADTVAGKLAMALKAEKLIFLTDVNGIRAVSDEEESRVSSLTIREAEKWMEEGKIAGGMVPKVKACIEAIASDVNRTHILNGFLSHTLLLEIFTVKGIGTMILKGGE